MQILFKKKNGSYFTTLMVSQMVIVLISILLIGSMTYYIAVKNLLRQVRETNRAVLKSVSNSVNMVLNAIDNVSIEMAVDKNVDDFIAYTQDHNDRRKLKLLDLQNMLNSLKNSRDYIYSIYIYYYRSDILVASIEGKYYRKDFFDTEWLTEYNKLESSKKPFVWQGPRKIIRSSRDVENNSLSQHVISLIRPIHLMPNVKTGLVVVNVLESTLYDLYKEVRLGKNGYMFIVDEQGRIISHQNKKLLNTVCHEEYIDRILKQQKDQDFIFKTGKQKLYISVQNSRKNNWKYIAITPYDELIERVGYLKKIILLICIVYLFVGALLSYFSSKKMYRPIGKAIDILKERVGQRNNEISYDVVNLGTMINQMIDSNIHLQRAWDKYFPLLGEHFLEQILKGRVPDRQELVERLHLIGMECQYYGVFLIAFDDYNDLKKGIGEKEFNLLKMYINSTINSFFEEINELKGQSVDMDDDRFTVLIASDKQSTPQKLYEMAECLKKRISDNRWDSYTFGISKMESGPEQIHHCYKQALASLRHRFYTGKGNIILIEDIEIANEDVEIFLQEREENLVHLHLINYDEEKLIKEMNDILEERFIRSKLSFEFVQPILTQFMNILNRFLCEQGCSLNDIFEDSRNVLMNLMKVETLEEAKFAIQVLINQTFEALKKSKGKNSVIIEKVKNYLQCNYNRDITLDLIAEQVYISKFYLSKVFKKETGMNFNEYLINIRIEKAKELLENTNDKIYEIAKKVGYMNHKSFTKIFKENNGMTPGQYRKQVLINKLK